LPVSSIGITAFRISTVDYSNGEDGSGDRKPEDDEGGEDEQHHQEHGQLSAQRMTRPEQKTLSLVV
jgi:hypothetical protein